MSRCCSSVGAAAERQFSKKRATNDLAQYRTKGPGSTARLLLAGIATAGQLHGRLLDIGSGVGALTFELLERGLTEAIGVDLSSVFSKENTTMTMLTTMTPEMSTLKTRLKATWESGDYGVFARYLEKGAPWRRRERPG